MNMKLQNPKILVSKFNVILIKMFKKRLENVLIVMFKYQKVFLKVNVVTIYVKGLSYVGINHF